MNSISLTRPKPKPIHKTLERPSAEAEDVNATKFAEDMGYETCHWPVITLILYPRAKTVPLHPVVTRAGWESTKCSGYRRNPGADPASARPAPISRKWRSRQGMVTMRQDGYLKALAGKTTLNEVNRVAATDMPDISVHIDRSKTEEGNTIMARTIQESKYYSKKSSRRRLPTFTCRLACRRCCASTAR